jgi:alanyl-tRNA synthetase
VEHVASVIGGRGGGKADTATATGDRVDGVQEAIQLAEQFARTKLGSS